MTSLIAALVLRWERRPSTLPAHTREHTSIVANSHRVRRLLPMNVQSCRDRSWARAPVGEE